MKDERVREYIFTKRIVAQQGVENAEAFTHEKDLQVDFVDNDEIVLNENSYVILDFGKELHGTIYFLTRTFDSANNKVRLRLGESVSECCSEIGGESNATNDHSLRDIETQLVKFSAMEFCQSGFRFARIDNIGEGKIFVRSVLAISVMHSFNQVGNFVCDDIEVNNIFNTACRTLMLNMQTYIWDGIKRDRLVWMGDMQPEVEGIVCLFGKNKLVNKSIEFAKRQYKPSEFFNWMPTYSLWFIIIVHDYCFQSGDTELVENSIDYIEEIAKVFNGLIDDNGKFNFYAFLDWPTNETPEAESGVNGLCFMAMNCAKEILVKHGRNVKNCDEIIEKIMRKTSDVTWAKQSAGVLVCSGLKPAEELHEMLTCGGAKGMSTFMSYFILSAVALGGDYQTALSMMKEYYGGMLKMGATSFWEDFDIDWMDNASPIDQVVQEGKKDIHGDNGRFCYKGHRHSLCHGWSCGPIQYLLHCVAGFKVLETGGKKLQICPHLDGLKWIDATFPTMYGAVKLHAENRDGKVYVKVNAPQDVEVILQNCLTNN